MPAQPDRDAIAREHRHPDAAVEEWVFATWQPPGNRDDRRMCAFVSGLRVFAAPAAPSWYWSAFVRDGEPLLHVAEWQVLPRPDPLLVKADGLWAEHICEAPFEQWTIANETYATALDDPDEALGRGYGVPSAYACDIEWYATGDAANQAGSGHVDGYAQRGVAHAVIDLTGGALTMNEAAAIRWHRWGDQLGPIPLAAALAHTGLRAPFAFPDATVADWVATADGWRARTANVWLPAGSN